MTYQRKIEEGCKKLMDKKNERKVLRHVNVGAQFLAHQKGIVKGDPIHMEVGDKVFPLTEICKDCPHVTTCAGIDDKQASEAQ